MRMIVGYQFYMEKVIKKNLILSEAAIYLISNMLVASIPFILLPFLTRYLSPEEYGQIAMFQVLVGALGAFLGLSVHVLVSRKYYEDITDKEIGEFLGSCLQVVLAMLIVSMMLMYTFKDDISSLFGIKNEWLIYGLLVSVSIIVIQLRLTQWQVRRGARKYGVMQVFQAVSNLIFTIVFVFIMLRGAEGRVLAQVLMTVLFLIISLMSLKKDGLLFLFVWNKAYIKEIFKFGLPLVPHVAGVFLLVTVDRVVITGELGLTATGVYMVAVQLSMALALVFDAINKAYVPWLYEQLKSDIIDNKCKIVRLTYYGYAIILIGAIFSFFVSPMLVNYIVGPEYDGVDDVIGWLVLGQAFSGMYILMANYIFYSKLTGLLSLITVMSGLVNVLLLFILIKYWGIEGAAIAFCISMALRFLLTCFVANYRFPMPWFSFWQKT
jgi:O-antigen/teichoic acid export membrane protein